MKYRVVSIFAWILLLISPGIAYSQYSYNTAELQTIISQLQAQIRDLEVKILELRTTLQVSEQELGERLVLERPLRKGMSGEDVRMLQGALSKIPEVYPEGLVTGYYGPLTESAVKRFQEKQGIVVNGSPETTGFGQVGPRTINKLNGLRVSASQSATQMTTESTTTTTSSATSTATTTTQTSATSSSTVTSSTSGGGSTNTSTNTTSDTSNATSSTSTSTPPTPPPPTEQYDLGISGVNNLNPTMTAGATSSIAIQAYLYECVSCTTSPSTNLIAFYTQYYPNDPPYSDFEWFINNVTHYGEQTISVPSLTLSTPTSVTWNGTMPASGHYLFVVKIDPSNTTAETVENNNGFRSEFRTE